MNEITVKNNTLSFNGKTYKCAVGKNGFVELNKKQEGDLKTPIGSFNLLYFFYRKDRIKKPKSKLQGKELTKLCAWCDDVNSPYYNMYCTLPCKYSHEVLTRQDERYDIIVVTNHNSNPVKKNKGSAIFFHIASKTYEPTQGCVAVSLSDMQEILKNIDENTKIVIKP